MFGPYFVMQCKVYVLSNFVIISLRKRDLVALLYLCFVAIGVLCVFLALTRDDLWSGI